VADANGTFPPIYLQKQSYKLILKTSADVTIDESDPVDSTESAVEQYVNTLLQTTLTEIISDLYAGKPFRTINNGTVYNQLFSVKSDATASDIGLNTAGNNLDINFSFVNTNSQNIRNAYITAVSTSKTAGSETGNIVIGSRSGYVGVETNSTERLRVTSTGNVGIGTTTPNARLDVANVGLSANTIQSILSRNPNDVNFALSAKSGAASLITSISNSLVLEYIGSGVAAAINFWRGGSNTDGSLSFDTNGVERMLIDSTGSVHFPSIGTTASAANAFLNSGSSPSNQLLRSTSSLRYKTDIINLTDIDANKIFSLRPITYKSNSIADDQTKTHFGLIAEEVAEIEPRLVHYVDDQPDGVQYERICVLLLKIVKNLRQEVDNLKAQIQEM
jgi:hypothetical protein